MGSLVLAPLVGAVVWSGVPLAGEGVVEVLHGGRGIAIDVHQAGGGTRGVIGLDGGRLRYTDDGGRTWVEAQVDAAYRGDFRGVRFLDADQVWAVGDGGAVHFSADGGRSWRWLNPGAPILDRRAEPQPAELWDIAMRDARQGWVAGTDGVLLFTQDGGRTWGEHPAWASPDAAPDLAVGSLDPFDPYAIEFVGGAGLFVPADFGRYCWSNDAGASWHVGSVTPCTAVLGHPYLELWDVVFDPVPAASGLHEGWMVGGIGHGDGQLFHSTDSGVTWSRVDRHAFGPEPIGDDNCTIPTFYGAALVEDPTAANGVTGLAVGYAQSAFRFVGDGAPAPVSNPCLDDCGALVVTSEPYWKQELPVPDEHALLDSEPPLRAVATADGRELWAAGDFGLVQTSRDGGRTWSEVVQEHILRIHSGDFVDAQLGVAIGQQYAIVRTTDGGRTWNAVFPTEAPTDGGLFGNDIALCSTGIGLAVGDQGFAARSADFGVTWTQFALPSSGLGSIGAGSGPAVGNAVDVLPIADGLHPNAVIAGRKGYFARSFDGGQSWSKVQLPFAGAAEHLRDVDFELSGSGVVGFVVGDNGTSFRTYDGGTSWEAIPFRDGSAAPDLNAVAMWDGGSRALTVGDDGAVYMLDELGRWVRIDVAVALGAPELAGLDLHSVDVSEDGSRWLIGGDGGELLQFDGLIWSRPKSGTSTRLRAIDLVAHDHGFLFGKPFLIAELR